MKVTVTVVVYVILFVRIIKSISDLDSLQNIDIDYNIVDEKLSRIRNISIDFLKRNLND